MIDYCNSVKPEGPFITLRGAHLGFERKKPPHVVYMSVCADTEEGKDSIDPCVWDVFETL